MICTCIFKLLVLISIFLEIYCSDRRTFRCDNNKFIYSHYFCDGGNDCGDNSDEESDHGCTRSTCGNGKFTCQSDKRCWPISVRCDRKNDCIDGSDEWNCDHELSITNCTVEEGKYLCKDGLRCLWLSETCNSIENCYDDSDENARCGQYNSQLCRKCLHSCVKSPFGASCFCNSTEKICQTLRKISFENVMLYSTVNEIKMINFTSDESSKILDAVNVTALTAVRDFLYWVTEKNNVSLISKKHIRPNNHESETLIYGTDLNVTSPITSIAVDWITYNIYFTLENSLSVCSHDGHLCTVLKSASRIGNVVLTPKAGIMFWTQKSKDNDSKADILASSMDGQNERILVNGQLSFSNSLVVDESSERIYWLDTELAKIESILFNGRGRRIERLNAGNFSSFSEFKNVLYWTSDRQNSVFTDYGEKHVGIFSNNSVLYTDRFVANNLYAYNPFFHRTEVSNPCAAKSCSGLCLLHRSSFGLNYTCVCENFVTIYNDRSNHWCVDSSEEQSTTEKEKIQSHSESPEKQFNATVKDKLQQSSITEREQIHLHTESPLKRFHVPVEDKSHQSTTEKEQIYSHTQNLGKRLNEITVDVSHPSERPNKRLHVVVEEKSQSNSDHQSTPSNVTPHSKTELNDLKFYVILVAMLSVVTFYFSFDNWKRNKRMRNEFIAVYQKRIITNYPDISTNNLI